MISRATSADIPSIAHLLRDAAAPFSSNMVSSHEWISLLSRHFNSGYAYSLYGRTGHPDGVVGYLRTEGFCLIFPLYVRPSARLRGIGACLIEQVASEGREPLLLCCDLSDQNSKDGASPVDFPRGRSGDRRSIGDFPARVGFMAVSEPWNDCMIRQFWPRHVRRSNNFQVHARASLLDSIVDGKRVCGF